MEKEIKTKGGSILENLTPTDNVKNNGIYESSLKYGIVDENIKNIALSGAYGSGKSSILKTFEKNQKNQYNFLNISLADFSGSKKNNKNLDIERSILQKMFYTVKNEEIPFSRFKRIKDITAQELQKYSLWLFIGLFWFFIAYKNKDLPEYLWFLKFDIVYIIGFIITF
ncbi:P-loop NTPase fold protein, partial [Poseidonibacter sp.]|uniref:YobI family P-loop NTPase n=1 Tax=Poseidonibacter sp. TaxID=2321188 RepID=UPI003C7840AE